MKQHLLEENEIWKVVPDFPDYFVSNMGRVKSIKKGKERFLNRSEKGAGYALISLFNKGASAPKSIKRATLVATVFIDNPDKNPIVNHINGIKRDDRASNLEWCTYSHNSIHARRTGLYKKKRPLSLIPVHLYKTDADYARKNYLSITSIIRNLFSKEIKKIKSKHGKNSIAKLLNEVDL